MLQEISQQEGVDIDEEEEELDDDQNFCLNLAEQQQDHRVENPQKNQGTSYLSVQKFRTIDSCFESLGSTKQHETFSKTFAENLEVNHQEQRVSDKQLEE